MSRGTAKSSHNNVFLSLCRQKGYNFVTEHVFCPTRKWRFDYACIEHKIAVEVEGGAFKKRTYIDKGTNEKITTIGGRHNSAIGFLNDIEKYNTATAMGWKVLRATPDKLLTMDTLKLISQCVDGCEKIYT